MYLRNYRLEKSIKKLDRDIEALTIASNYLSNIDEINGVREKLNRERQELANELYFDDNIAYDQCRDDIRSMIGRELGKDDQKNLLEDIKEIFGRQSPNPSKDSVGLNAWLKEIDAETEWVQKENSDWAVLIIKGLKPHRNSKQK